MTSDVYLVRKSKAGNYQAFEQLVSRYEKRLFLLAFMMLRHRENAEDMVQNTFLSVLEHLDDFREEASFATWINVLSLIRP